uniref:Uncharacterized protein n=1 Tax=Oryza punctata TaxID=4537 RepID=A0A0E0JQ06_ORYPU
MSRCNVGPGFQCQRQAKNAKHRTRSAPAAAEPAPPPPPELSPPGARPEPLELNPCRRTGAGGRLEAAASSFYRPHCSLLLPVQTPAGFDAMESLIHQPWDNDRDLVNLIVGDAEYLSLSSRLKSALGSLLKHNVLKTPEIVHTS